MAKTITAEFATRRDAETAVEHLVQEHKLPADAVRITAASQDNSAGTQAAGSDLEDGHTVKGDTEGEPALAGKVRVSAEVDEDKADKVVSSFETYGGSVAA